MNEQEYLELMKFPMEWRTLDLLPASLLEKLIATYEPGSEEASEHDRNGAFHWWLKQRPEKDVLIKLVRLSYLDPDQIMAADVRAHILESTNADEDVRDLIRRGSSSSNR